MAESALLGESPLWHPDEQVLCQCDTPGKWLHRFDPASGSLPHRDLDCDAASRAPMPGGELLPAMREGLWRFRPGTGTRTLLVEPPYDTHQERFNGGRSDRAGGVSGSARSMNPVSRPWPRCTASAAPI